ncbi:MAG: hypothetical protein ACI834_000202, partial [Colwellia sp.]
STFHHTALVKEYNGHSTEDLIANHYLYHYISIIII